MKAMGKVTLTLGLMIIVSLFLTSCSGVVTPELQLDLDEDINTVTPETGSGNLENTVTEDTEEPVTEEPGTVYPQKWATGDGTVENPWANNCIQKAYDFVPDGGTIFLKAGYYQLAGLLTISKQINVIGEGIDRTFIVTADASGFQVLSDYCSLKDFTVDGDAQTNNAESTYCIRTYQADYLLLENIKVKNSGYYGMSIVSSYSTFRNIYGVDNYRHGIHPGACHYNVYKNIYCWNNGNSGFNDNGGQGDHALHNIYDNLRCWNNGDFGITLYYQSSGTITNSLVHSNGIYGIVLKYCHNFTIENCFVHSNDMTGVYMRYSDNINLSNVISKNNNAIGGGNYCGIHIEDTPFTILSSCQSYDDRDSPLQNYAIWAEGTTKYVEITNCKLTPNKQYAIKNTAGAVITITETKLARFYQL